MCLALFTRTKWTRSGSRVRRRSVRCKRPRPGPSTSLRVEAAPCPTTHECRMPVVLQRMNAECLPCLRCAAGGRRWTTTMRSRLHPTDVACALTCPFPSVRRARLRRHRQHRDPRWGGTKTTNAQRSNDDKVKQNALDGFSCWAKYALSCVA